MKYIRRIFAQDKTHEIAFPAEPSYSFFSFRYADNPAPQARRITFVYKEKNSPYDNHEIVTEIISAGGESRIRSELKSFLFGTLKVNVDDLLIFENIKNKGQTDLYDTRTFNFQHIKQSSPDYQSYIKLCNFRGAKDNHKLFLADVTETLVNTKVPPPVQIIIYGPPGTGKSHEVTERWLKNVSEENIIRTTFHPGTDYSSFIGCYKPTMETNPEGKEEIKYRFVSQPFLKAYEKAWNDLNTPIYLVIEEINRGNCAQIFGDIFQLLDRASNGFSKFSVTPDDDIRKYLEEHLTSQKSLNGIANGKMTLPNNLNLIATMNTSDQSLFPMDSAFKRRWEWEPKQIDYSNKETSQYIIEISTSKYSWNSFLEKVNAKIFALTRSEDKQLGNFFIKLYDSGKITQKMLVNKVMFYLWSDVCKDELNSPNYFLKTKNKQGDFSDFTFSDLFSSGSSDILIGFMEYLEVAVLDNNESLV